MTPLKTFRVVQGLHGGSFPVDMLRYDSCWPRTENDSANISLTFSMDLMDKSLFDSVKRELMTTGIELVTNSKYITRARWESFGWQVKEFNE
jgi:hypothetical protein